MASLGHLAIGLAANRISDMWGPPSVGPKHAWLKAAFFWSALSFLPDADVIGFAFGVRYEDEWGHRGATHSLAFSFMLGAAIGLLAPRFKLPAWRTGIIASLVLASHCILDTFTDGGLGIALFWPFDLTRYFAPWRPIPVSPIGLAFFSPYGMFVALWEILIFAPLWWFALNQKAWGPPSGGPKRRAVFIGAVTVWVVLLWLMMSTSALRDRVLATILRDDTEYSRHFTTGGFDAIERGMSEVQVRDRIGRPFNEFVFYEGGDDACRQIRIEDEFVTDAQPADACKRRTIVPSRSRSYLYATLGEPGSSCWVYSRPKTGGFFRARGVCFIRGRVDEVVRRWIRE